MHMYGNKQDLSDGAGSVISLIITGTAEEIADLKTQLSDSVSYMDGHDELGRTRRFVEEPITVLEQTARTIIETGSVEP